MHLIIFNIITMYIMFHVRFYSRYINVYNKYLIYSYYVLKLFISLITMYIFIKITLSNNNSIF